MLGEGGIELGTAVVDASGNFSVNLGAAQINGEQLSASQSDVAGNESNSVNLIAPVLANVNFYLSPLYLLSFLPLYILWALPTVGWLMFCSAWARRLPFLWATAVPVLTCAMVSFTDIFPGIEIPHDNLWYTVAYRGLLSIAPGAWIPTIAQEPTGPFDGPKDISGLVDITSSWAAFGNADIWIGAAVGALLIYAAADGLLANSPLLLKLIGR